MEWYYTQNDTQAGPVTEQQLAEMVRLGTVQPEELAWREGMEDWQAIKLIGAFKQALPPPPVVRPRTPPSGAQKSVTNPYQQPRTPTQYQRPRGPIRQIDNGLVPAILATVLCCPIPGIVGIVYAAQVNGHLQRGDYRRAQEAANSAKTWTWVAFGLGLVAVVAQVFLAAAAGGF